MQFQNWWLIEISWSFPKNIFSCSAFESIIQNDKNNWLGRNENSNNKTRIYCWIFWIFVSNQGISTFFSSLWCVVQSFQGLLKPSTVLHSLQRTYYIIPISILIDSIAQIKSYAPLYVWISVCPLSSPFFSR